MSNKSKLGKEYITNRHQGQINGDLLYLMGESHVAFNAGYDAAMQVAHDICESKFRPSTDEYNHGYNSGVDECRFSILKETNE